MQPNSHSQVPLIILFVIILFLEMLQKLMHKKHVFDALAGLVLITNEKSTLVCTCRINYLVT
jgi:hypothetical protein